MTPADVPTPDAIRPEWEPWVEKAARAIHVVVHGCECGTPDLYDWRPARAAIAAVCGDIVEAARRDALGEAAEAIRAAPCHGQESGRRDEDARIVTDLRDADTPRRPQEPPQSDVGAEVVPAPTPDHPEAATPRSVRALLRQLELDRKVSSYWRDKWAEGHGDQHIEAWLESLADWLGVPSEGRSDQ